MKWSSFWAARGAAELQTYQMKCTDFYLILEAEQSQDCPEKHLAILGTNRGGAIGYSKPNKTSLYYLLLEKLIKAT